MNKIYIIEELSGQYEDFFANQLFYFTSKEEAELYLILIEEETLRLHLLAQKIRNDVSEYYNSLGDNEPADDDYINELKLKTNYDETIELYDTGCSYNCPLLEVQGVKGFDYSDNI